MKRYLQTSSSASADVQKRLHANGRSFFGGKIPIRILHVTECYEGGVSRAINAITAALPLAEHLLLYAGSDIPDSTFEVVRPLPKGLLRRTAELSHAIEIYSPDVVHAHSSWAGVYSRLGKLPVPVIYQPHCYATEMATGARALAFGAAERLLGRRTASVAVLSAHENELAIRFTPNARRVYVPNTPSISPQLFRQSQNPRSRTVLMVGRISKQKDPHFFAAIASQVRAKDPSISFTWAGDGDFQGGRTALEAAGVRITGWLDTQNLAEAISSSGLYFHSASYEGFPLSVLDAAAGGLPIIARDIPAFAGAGLNTVRGVGQASQAILDILNNCTLWTEHAARSSDLLNVMNESAQLKGLYELYGMESATRATA